VLSRLGEGSAEVPISDSYDGSRDRCKGLAIHDGRYDLLGWISCRCTSCMCNLVSEGSQEYEYEYSLPKFSSINKHVPTRNFKKEGQLK